LMRFFSVRLPTARVRSGNPPGPARRPNGFVSLPGYLGRGVAIERRSATERGPAEMKPG
jgi:hypothetical protein